MARSNDWVPQEFIERMNYELAFHGEEECQPEKTATRIMRESLPYVAMATVKSALHDPDSRVRLAATNIILDRVLGKAGVNGIEAISPTEELFNGMMEEVQKMLAAQASE